ncbi:hypothetical protein C7H19_03905 [Aphanothece hegewaldii CCALA 016]|uniref:P/Homo B domain-containing protein n=1 Tax=Aphanothece hegewaldii CCALA 016 TaxID=2107694 RepID=A0A2T1M1U2_9CHRO|nr:proprotein convertase P-domain-containing protein [Aphanothece hegewaldii]PSF38660.1 hypothetical protein C7H19_03905 [Aphanothece hegewaldii CCALA 016]
MATISGTNASDNLLGTSANDIIYGYDGNDTLDGGLGADTLYGGKGDDIYIINNVGDKIVEISAEGIDTVRALINYTLGEYVNNLTLIGTASINATGNEYDNVVIGNQGNNILQGAAGKDTIIGGSGTDKIVETGDFSYTLTNTSLTRMSPSASTPNTFSSNTPIAIADYLAVTSTINVSGVSSNISDLNVQVNISHTWNSDLRVFLINPLGTQIKLFSEVGIGGKGFINTILDDEASTSITKGSGTFTGTFRPESMLSSFDGTNPNGSWKLKIIDAAEGDIGTLNSWAVTFNSQGTPPNPNSEVDTLSEIEQANLTGGNSNNKLDATTFTVGSVTLNGSLGNDTLIGSRSNDTIIGGLGNDILTGGLGSDRFTYNAKGEGIDQITDFNTVDDTIVVSATGFGGGLTIGTTVSTSQWFIGTAATTASHRFIYNNTNGNLFFDVDGNGANAAIQLAILSGMPTLSQNDILVIA